MRSFLKPADDTRILPLRAPSTLLSGLLVLVALPSAAGNRAEEKHPFERAWREAGLTERQAVAHALDRLAFGPMPGQIDDLTETGLVQWLEDQLGTVSNDQRFEERLAQRYDVLGMSDVQIAETFPSLGPLLRRAAQEGRLDLENLPSPGREMSDEDRAQIEQYLKEQDARPQRELVVQTVMQKIDRAVSSSHQLQEVLVDFWFNHFNVSMRDNESRRFILAYERDAIRPYVLGSFREMLEATAKHPAMLGYLDNFQSRAEEGVRTAMGQQSMRGQQRERGLRRDGLRGGNRGRETGSRNRSGNRMRNQPDGAQTRQRRRPPSGLNENYARELLELHTLGVDGGYTQKDVEEVARAFTGWTMVPPRRPAGPDGMAAPQAFLGTSRARQAGFVSEGLFIFHPGFHDAESKTVLGKKLRAGRGMQDGLDVLDMLAVHPSTARFLAHKLAVRFIADEPPTQAVDSMAAAFLASQGDLRAVVRAMLEQPAFWTSRGSKVKTPFELVASSMRSLGAEVVRPSRQLIDAFETMGQPLYAYDAPTGYPDRASQWLSSSSLLARMNFTTALAAGEIPGIAVKLPPSLREASQWTQTDEPERALETVLQALLPERDWSVTFEQIAGLLSEEPHPEASDRLRQVVGWTLGSPEYQRR